MTWAADYIGIPFVPGGRDRTGCDCWGLVHLISREVFSRVLPDLGNLYVLNPEELAGSAAKAFSSFRPLVDGERVSTPEAGDIVVMKYRGFPCHVGIVVDQDHVLHVERGADSILSRLSSPQISARVEGIYRCRN